MLGVYVVFLAVFMDLMAASISMPMLAFYARSFLAYYREHGEGGRSLHIPTVTELWTGLVGWTEDEVRNLEKTKSAGQKSPESSERSTSGGDGDGRSDMSMTEFLVEGSQTRTGTTAVEAEGQAGDTHTSDTVAGCSFPHLRPIILRKLARERVQILGKEK